MEIPRSEHPRPDFRRNEWINLNGEWQFEIDTSNTGKEKKFYIPDKKLKEKILVPFPPESKLSGIGNRDFMVSVWYQRKLEIPEKWKNKRIFVNFGAVDYLTTVWLNGMEIGSHKGGYTPFRFEITNFLKNDNILTVNAYDDTRTHLQPSGKQSDRYNSYGCLYTRTTGIWQTVYLEATGKNYIKRFKFYPDVETGDVALLIDVEGKGEIKVEVFQEKEKVAEKMFAGSGLVAGCVNVKNFSVWSPSSPVLYDVKITLLSDKEIQDEVETYFGFRKIEVKENKILLNGKPIFMRMVLDQGYYPDGIYTAPSQQGIINDIKIAMDMGFNGARLHQKVFEPLMLYYADKLGYLLWGEYPNWGLKNRIHRESFDILITEWIEVLERDFNHPSVIGWCPLNETHQPSQDDELVKDVYRITRNIDWSRPVIDTSGYIHVETDIYDCHNYKQNPDELKKDFEPFLHDDRMAWRNYPDRDALYRGQPYWVSEYGGIWWDEEGNPDGWGYGERPKTKEEFLERYRKLTEILLNHPKICGFCYTQLYDIEQEVNGLYTFKRKPKFSKEIIKKINSNKAKIEE